MSPSLAANFLSRTAHKDLAKIFNSVGTMEMSKKARVFYVDNVILATKSFSLKTFPLVLLKLWLILLINNANDVNEDF